jgi:hypothetical protein
MSKSFKLPLIAFLSILGGLGTSWSAGCIYSFDQDNCLDVYCPTGCYQDGYGVHKSACQMQGDLCCNCWFRQRICKNDGTNNPCTVSTGSPNGKAWESVRKQCQGPCHTETNVTGTICLTADADPFF